MKQLACSWNMSYRSLISLILSCLTLQAYQWDFQIHVSALVCLILISFVVGHDQTFIALLTDTIGCCCASFSPNSLLFFKLHPFMMNSIIFQECLHISGRLSATICARPLKWYASESEWSSLRANMQSDAAIWCHFIDLHQPSVLFSSPDSYSQIDLKKKKKSMKIKFALKIWT